TDRTEPYRGGSWDNSLHSTDRSTDSQQKRGERMVSSVLQYQPVITATRHIDPDQDVWRASKQSLHAVWCQQLGLQGFSKQNARESLI
ncbi:hypothetical protein Bpfe_018669, partial [Biomphalaria pfeifferi]